MTRDEYLPLSPAPHTGIFEELDVFGSPTGVVAFVNKGELLPGAPRSFTWRPLRELSLAELRARATEYREMAQAARTEQARQGLLRLSERFEELAEQREARSGSAKE